MDPEASEVSDPFYFRTERMLHGGRDNVSGFRSAGAQVLRCRSAGSSILGSLVAPPAAKSATIDFSVLGPC